MLHRHQLAWLSAAGWRRLLARGWDTEAHACLHHWAEHRLPAVVTRQLDDGSDTLALGLCAPRRWSHRRIALRVAPGEVLHFGEFPRLEEIVMQLPQGAQPPARQLAAALQACGATARVYGSQGWQHLSGLQHVRDGSDLDLWVGVAGVDHADAVAAALDAFSSPSRRLDGELVFEGDAAVAWREWLAWRGGRVRSLLVKRLRGASTPSSMEAPA